MVGSKTLKVGTFNRHLLTRKNKKQKIKRVIVAALMLTSMVDMFSLLVIFLLQSFSNSPEVVAQSKSITLPVASSGLSSVDAPVLALSLEDVILDQKQLGSAQQILSQPQALLTHLQNLRSLWQASHPKETFSGDIHLQADKDLPSTLISQFVNMLISQGYSTVHLAVIAKGR